MQHTILDAVETKEQAVKEMRRYAARLRKRRVTGRYGVYIKQYDELWWVCLRDRETQQ